MALRLDTQNLGRAIDPDRRSPTTAVPSPAEPSPSSAYLDTPIGQPSPGTDLERCLAHALRTVQAANPPESGHVASTSRLAVPAREFGQRSEGGDRLIQLPRRVSSRDCMVAEPAPFTTAAFSRSEPLLAASENASAPPSAPDRSPSPHPSVERPHRPSKSPARIDARYFALLGLVESEKAYLADLLTITEIYLPALADLASPEVHSAIARNIVALVALHLRLCTAFNALETEVGWRSAGATGDWAPTDDAKLIAAAERVADVYTDLAPDFAVYEAFCASHVDATSELRTLASSLGPADWLAFENRCVGAASAASGGEERLHLADFMIKPVQRVMRYALLFAALARALPAASSARSAVDRADVAYKAVAARVDAARHKRELDRRTVLVASRIELPSAAQPAFLAFLGQLQLVGALQVVHIPPTSIVPVQGETRVRYYGIVLYPTHVLFLKAKRADCYEPRHWLPLRALAIESVPDGEGLLPFAVRLSYGEHRFELGALTEQERNVWASQLLRAQVDCRASWDGGLAQFDDTTVCSLASPTSPRDEATGPLTPPATTGANVRHRLSSTASILLGRTPAAVRATVDMRFADVFSDECVVARVQRVVPRRKSFASGEAAAANSLKAAKGHRRRLSADVVMSMLQSTLGGDSAEPRAPLLRSRPSGSHMVGRSTPPVSRAASISEAGERSEGESGKSRRPSMTGSRSWTGSWRRPRTASTPAAPVASIFAAAPTDGSAIELEASPPPRIGTLPPVASPTEELVLEEPDAVTSVARNVSTSSSGSSASNLAEAMTPSPASSVPPSPMAPYAKPWYDPDGLKDVLASLSPGGRKVSAPAPQLSPEQEEQARAAEAFLRTGRVEGNRSYTAAWRESWKKRRASIGATMPPMPSILRLGPPTTPTSETVPVSPIAVPMSRNSSGRSSGSSSSSFVPTLSPTLASPASPLPPTLPAKAAGPSSLSSGAPPRLQRSATDSVTPSIGAAPRRPNMLRRKSLRVFRGLGARFSPIDNSTD